VNVRLLRPAAVVAASVATLFALLAAESGAAPSPAPSASSAAAVKGVASASPSPASPASPEAYDAFVKKAQRQHGLIDLLTKDDDLYLDLSDDQFEKPFVIAPVLAAGVGEAAFAGRIYPTFLLEFKRVGKRVLWIEKNTDFAAPAHSTAANALAISVSDSVIASSPIVAEDDATKRVVVSASFFLTDFENVGRDLGGRGGQPLILFGPPAAPRFTVDPTRSYIERTKALPKNDEVLASLAFSGPPGQLSGAPDGRGVRLRMHYSIVEAPDASAYVPRLADDRVGYFVTSQKRFDDDTRTTPFVRFIDRWNFKRGPIVYYLTNEIPKQYKPVIRAALLSWNAAFAKAGIPDAVEVRDQPDDPAWDPDDVRYSTVRWITSDSTPFAAYGPHIADPRTGEILRVEIVIDGESMRSIKRGFVDQVLAARSLPRDPSGLPLPDSSLALACPDAGDCDTYGEDSAELAATGSDAIRARGATPAQIERYADDWLRSVVLHESGHNFGLRHNFISATLYPLAEIRDPKFSRAHGIVGSVMGYTPVNLSPPGRPQGEYFQLKLGPYDEWAIRYGYEAIPNAATPDDERIALERLASESTLPQYAYATDEDANGPLAIDPRVATFDLSSDPLAYDADQLALVDGLIASLDRTFPRDGRSYADERATFETMLRSYQRAAMLAVKYIGGAYTSRDHRGQPGGAPPLRPVPREASRRAFGLLADRVFSSRALHWAPRLVDDLGPDHFLRRGEPAEAPEFPVAERVGAMQDAVLYAMFSPETMSRLADAPFTATSRERTMSLADLFGWTQAAVWDDLSPQLTSIDPIRRALQRRYASLLVAYALAPSFLLDEIGYPNDTAPLATFELRRLANGLDAALRSPRLDVATRAHLEDVRERVRHALDAGAVRGA
jgi:hypothetical protein